MLKLFPNQIFIPVYDILVYLDHYGEGDLCMPKKKTTRTEESTQVKAFSVTQIDVTPDLLKRFERDLKRGSFNVVTPHTLAQSYEIRISTAKKLLREAARKGLVTLYSGGRTPIYIRKTE